MNLIFLTFSGILVLSVICGKYIHVHNFKYATEGSASLLLGTCITGFVSLCYWLHTRHPLPEHSLELPDSVFFHILLPPVIFYAGFSIKKRMFFANFCTIFTFGFFGTLTSAALISCAAAAALNAMGMAPKLLLQSSLALGAICACSDTVGILQIMDKRAYPVLYNLVFGEGIVNDAVAVVLLGTVNNLTARHSALSLSVVLQLLLGFVSLFLSSLLLGVGMGLLSALLVRHIFGKRHDCDREVLLLALLGYMSYLLADAADLSAILAVFFCGVTMSHYTWHSMCPAAQALALHTFRLAAGLMEMILYAYSGINMWTSALWQQPAPDSATHLKHAVILAGVLLVAIVAARVAFTYPVAAAATWLVSCGHSRQQQRRISWLDATVILWGGLARGAITLALAYHTFAPARKGVPTADHQVMVLAVVLVVLVSTLVLGTVTGPLMEWILIQHKRQQHKQHKQLQQEFSTDSSPADAAAWHASLQLNDPAAAGTAAAQQAADGMQDPLCIPLLQDRQQQKLDTSAAGVLIEGGNAFNGHSRSGSTSTSGLDSTGEEDLSPRQLPGTIAVAPPNSPDPAAAAAAAVGVAAGPAVPQLTPFAAAASAPLGPTAAAAAGAPEWHIGTAAAAAAPRRWSIGSAGSAGYLAARGRLPSMDELTEYVPDTVGNTTCGSPISSSPSLSSIAEAAETAGAGHRPGSRHGVELAAPAGEMHHQQQLLLAQQQQLVRQQLQRLQLSRYSSAAAAGELPFVSTPSDSDPEFAVDESLGTYLALSRAPSIGSTVGGTFGGVTGSTAVGRHLLRQQQQQRQQGDAAPAAVPAPPQAGVLTGLTGDQAGSPGQGREQQWYLKQQQRLLRQLAQLQRQAQQHHCTTSAQRQGQYSGRTSGAGGRARPGWTVHSVWRWFDVHYMQPVFGGREVAARTSMPMEFEHFGVEV